MKLHDHRIPTIFTFITLLSIGAFTAILYIFPTSNTTASALTYQTESTMSFTFSPMISINVSSSTIDIPTLAPGTTAESDPITVTVATNTAYGYSLYADVGSNDTQSTYYNTSDLTHTDTDTATGTTSANASFTSISTNASLPSLTTDNTWGYSTSNDNGTTWSAYNGLPTATSTESSTSTNNPALLIDTKDPGDSSRSIDFKIAARSSATQPSGTYSNVINFYAVGKPEQPPTDLTFVAGEHIDTLIVADSSQKWKPFYTTSESAGRSIPFSSPTKGNKYLVTVVPEPGYVLSSDSAKSSYKQKFTSGTLASSTLLTTIYTVGDAGDIITVSAKRAGNDAAHPAYTAMQSLTVTQCPATSSSSQQGINVTDARDGKSYTVAKFGDYCYMLSNIRIDGDTTLTPATSNVTSDYTIPTDTGSGRWQDSHCHPRMASIDNEYFYNWPAATARDVESSSCPSEDTSVSLGDICPAGWSLPTYNDIDISSLWENGANPGGLISAGFMDYRGRYNLGQFAEWWSSRRNNAYYAYAMEFYGTGAFFDYYGTNRYTGISVRCMRSTQGA